MTYADLREGDIIEWGNETVRATNVRHVSQTVLATIRKVRSRGRGLTIAQPVTDPMVLVRRDVSCSTT